MCIQVRLPIVSIVTLSWFNDLSSFPDPYENIYTVIRGFKHFILFPPTEGHLLVEKPFPRATYIRLHPRGPLILTPVQQEPSPASEFQPPLTVSWATMDPALPIEGTMPLRVTLCAGETLYLPAGEHDIRLKRVKIG